MIVKSFRSLEINNDFVIFNTDNSITRHPMSQCTSEFISLYMKTVEKKYKKSHSTELTPPDITTSTTVDPETGDSYIIYTLTYPDPDVEDVSLEDFIIYHSS